MDGTGEATTGLGVAPCHNDRSMTYGAADEVIPSEPHDSPVAFLDHASGPHHAQGREVMEATSRQRDTPRQDYLRNGSVNGCTRTALSYKGGRAYP